MEAFTLSVGNKIFSFWSCKLIIKSFKCYSILSKTANNSKGNLFVKNVFLLSLGITFPRDNHY